MQRLADAVVFAVMFLDLRADHERADQDEHVLALDAMAAILRRSGERERRALQAALERAIDAELERERPRMEYLERYRSWMHDLLGDQPR